MFFNAAIITSRRNAGGSDVQPYQGISGLTYVNSVTAASLATGYTDPVSIVSQNNEIFTNIIGNSAYNLDKFTLEQPFDITNMPSLISGDASVIGVTSQDFRWSSDGTVFIHISNTNFLRRRTAATPFSPSTLSNNTSHDFSSYGISETRAMSMNADKLWVLCNTTDKIYQFSWTGAEGDIDNVSLDGSWDFSSYNTNCQGFTISYDGLTLLLGATGSDEVIEFAMPSAFSVVGTMTEVQRVNVEHLAGEPLNITNVQYIGNEDIVVSSSQSDKYYQFRLQQPSSPNYDMANTVYDGKVLDYTTINSTAQKMSLLDDQLLLSSGSAWIYILKGGVYTDITSYSFNGIDGRQSSTSTSTHGAKFNRSDLSASFFTTSEQIHTITFPTKGDVVNATFSSNTGFSAETTDGRDMEFSSNGMFFYILEGNAGDIRQYKTVAPYAHVGATYMGIILDVLNGKLNPRGIAFSDDGRYLYVVFYESTVVNKFVLSTPWQIATATFHSEYNFVAQTFRAYAIEVEGNKMYVLDVNESKIFQYTLNE